MDKFNRSIQRETLQLLYDAYPNELTGSQMKELENIYPDDDTFVANLLYLHQHQLINSGLTPSSDGYALVNRPTITHRGIDFIRDDGGLGAILNIQTVKFHDSTIIALEDIIRVANLPDAQKKEWSTKLHELGEDAIKRLMLELLTKGTLNLTAALQLIEKFLHQG